MNPCSFYSDEELREMSGYSAHTKRAMFGGRGDILNACAGIRKDWEQSVCLCSVIPRETYQMNPSFIGGDILLLSEWPEEAKK